MDQTAVKSDSVVLSDCASGNGSMCLSASFGAFHVVASLCWRAAVIGTPSGRTQYNHLMTGYQWLVSLLQDTHIHTHAALSGAPQVFSDQAAEVRGQRDVSLDH